MRLPSLILLALVVIALDGSGQAALAAVDTPASADFSAWNHAIAWGLEQQRLLHRELADHLRALEAGGSAAAAWALVTGSFLYGVFHAAGPGHGKAVIATYLLTHKSRLKRGMWLAAATALCQGAVAILLVYGLIFVAGWLPREAQTAITWSERLSFVLLAALGALFAFRALCGLVAALRPPVLRMAEGHAHHQHGPNCGCSHGPSSHQIEQAHGLRAVMGVLFSVGLRPCSGAVLVLVLANVLDLAWAGIVSVAAMSVGTAITVAILAVIAVKARDWAAALAGVQAKRARWAGSALALLGGVVICLFGVSLLISSFGPAHPLKL